MDVFGALLQLGERGEGVAGLGVVRVVHLNQNRAIPLYSGVEPYLVRPGLHVPFIGGTIAYRWEEVR